ncbi:D-xylose 1-dehydrogenase [Dirofilaria immitis]
MDGLTYEFVDNDCEVVIPVSEACSVNADVAVRWETTETACSMKSFADTVASFALQSITIRKSLIMQMTNKLTYIRIVM